MKKYVFSLDSALDSEIGEKRGTTHHGDGSAALVRSPTRLDSFPSRERRLTCRIEEERFQEPITFGGGHDRTRCFGDVVCL